MPVLTNIGYTVDWKQVTVITWGGLRGAVGLALALVVVQTPGVPLAVGSKVRLYNSVHSVLNSILYIHVCVYSFCRCVLCEWV